MGVKKLAQQMIEHGTTHQASDLYILPKRKGYELAFRYHEQKIIYKKISTETGEKLILFFKYLADMDVAEKRRTQVGAGIMHVTSGKQRLRFSSVADFQGRESLVIRFLHDFSNENTYTYFFPYQLREIEKQAVGRGLYIFCGPTGSGKTTTMYHLAMKLANNKKQVIAIEDPIEIEEDNFLQLQVNEKIGVDYEELIKVCLRNRPDVLIVGEIRDKETARMVVRGALTGHTIYSTLHVAKKENVVARLLELGVSFNELNQCLRGVIFQRIVPSSQSIISKNFVSYGAIFDSLFFQKEEIEHEKKEDTWKKSLRKAWSYGFISTETFEKEVKEGEIFFN